METRKLELTEAQMKNLAIFLNRVSVTGLQEVAAMSELASAINKPLLDMIKPNDDSSTKEQAETPAQAPAEEGKP